MRMYELDGKRPVIGRNCLIADTVTLIGDVVIGDDCSLWPGVVIRADTTPIRIGNNVHIEDNCILHTAAHIEDNVMIGHGCCIEGFVGHDTLIGNTATLLPLSRVGAFSCVAAGSVVADGAEFPEYSFLVGQPARRHSAIDPEDPSHRLRLARTYLEGPRGMIAMVRRYRAQGLWAMDGE
ncbi:MAG: gamma carbonic anhydrase family protein [Porticoccaceae bacterium]|nr:MAG: gamma carbonic anhydrase family protein [Porticoccaceae bacterium]